MNFIIIYYYTFSYEFYNINSNFEIIGDICIEDEKILYVNYFLISCVEFIIRLLNRYDLLCHSCW